MRHPPDSADSGRFDDREFPVAKPGIHPGLVHKGAVIDAQFSALSILVLQFDQEATLPVDPGKLIQCFPRRLTQGAPAHVPGDPSRLLVDERAPDFWGFHRDTLRQCPDDSRVRRREQPVAFLRERVLQPAASRTGATPARANQTGHAEDTQGAPRGAQGELQALGQAFSVRFALELEGDDEVPLSSGKPVNGSR